LGWIEGGNTAKRLEMVAMAAEAQTTKSTAGLLRDSHASRSSEVRAVDFGESALVLRGTGISESIAAT
jgi:hypothetical protein